MEIELLSKTTAYMILCVVLLNDREKNYILLRLSVALVDIAEGFFYRIESTLQLLSLNLSNLRIGKK